MDIIKDLGALSLSSRLKRLSERLAKDVTNVYADFNIDFEAKWFTFVYALYNNPPIAVTELAKYLSVSHTAINQTSDELLRKGYIISLKGTADERQRLLTLSKKGQSLVKSLLPIWQKIKEANQELLEITAPDFLGTIDAIENELEKMNMYERVFKIINGTLPAKIVIHEYSAKMKKYFKQLNYEWLEEYFEIEEKDRKILLNPKNKIINSGGAILFAEMDGDIVGTCAIIKHPNGIFELAKMAVTAKYRSRGIGLALLNEAVKKAKKLGAGELYLLTNKTLIAANVLYKKFGFERTKDTPFTESEYKRETYAMKLILSKSKKV